MFLNGRESGYCFCLYSCLTEAKGLFSSPFNVLPSVPLPQYFFFPPCIFFNCFPIILRGGFLFVFKPFLKNTDAQMRTS